MKVTERMLCNLIVEVLNLNGCFCWRTNAGQAVFETNDKKRMVRIGKAGTSDIIGMTKDGRFLACEVKLPSKRKNVTLLQQDFLDEVRRHGGIGVVVTSEEEAINSLKKGRE